MPTLQLAQHLTSIALKKEVFVCNWVIIIFNTALETECLKHLMFCLLISEQSSLLYIGLFGSCFAL